MSANQPLKQKDRVYYTGDMANASAWCQVLCVTRTAYGVSYDLLRIEEKDVIRSVPDSHIGREYFGHCNPRFVTGEAYDAYRNKALESLTKQVRAAGGVLQ